MRYENFGVLNMNPNIDSTWKRCSEFVSISTHALPYNYGSLRCVKEVINSLLDYFFRKVALVNNHLFLYPFCLLAYRLKLLSFKSNYHKGPPWWISKLIAD
jgi:hypothetical protein